MGIDLRLLPVDASVGPNAGNCHTILNCPQDYEMFDAIRAVALPLPANHDYTSHLGARTQSGEPTYGRLTTDAYGQEYTWVTAIRLWSILQGSHPAHPVTGFLENLGLETMVILDWH